MNSLSNGATRGRRWGGFTISELLIACGLVSLVGLAFIFGSNFMLRSFAHTMAINFSHQEARGGVQKMLYTIHNSIAPIQLVSVGPLTNGRRTVSPVSASTTAAQGLAVQTTVGGPFPIAGPTASGSSIINVLINSSAGFTPSALDMLVIPTHTVEKFVKSVGTYQNSIYPITIEDSDGLSPDEEIKTATVTSTAPTTGIILVYFTRPTVFLAENGTLRQYDVDYATGASTPSLVGTGTLITNGLAKTDPNDATKPFLPFATPTLNSSGTPDATQVAAINMSTDDLTVSNLGFAATNMFINSKIPTRNQFAQDQTIRDAGSEANTP